MGGGKGGGGGFPGEGTFLVEPISYWRQRVGTYPGNNHTWWAYKRPIEVGSNEPPKYYLEVFDPGMRHQITVTNTRTAPGHYIYNAFHIDRSAASGVPNLPVEGSAGARPSCVAFFAGRAFYAGVNATKFSSRIYFSQIIERDAQVEHCYQQQDPTQEDAPDLLPSDGGVIVIPEMAEVVGLVPKGAALFAIATNGVWQIGGDEGIGFRANGYSVTKLSDKGGLSSSSIVIVDGTPVWWSRSSINTIQMKSPIEGEVLSLTDNTIKSFFEAIPEESKRWAKGAYNHQSKIVQWLYASEAPVDQDDYNVYDSILNFNVLTGAFYPWTTTDDTVRLKGIVALEGDAVISETVPVHVGDEPVYVDDEEVVADYVYRQAVDSRFKYIVQVREKVEPL